jgi:hypothetical protein
MEIQGITSSSSATNLQQIGGSAQYGADSLVIGSLGASLDDTVSVGDSFLTKSLTVTAQEILFKLNQILGDKVPGGIESLKPEDTTSEATADRVVTGITAFFDAYAKQNPELDAEELIEQFMSEARKGVEEGYNDAFEVLKGLGAFEYDGVQEGVEKTKALIEQKLKAFEVRKREELGVETVSSVTSTEIVKQAAGALNVLA